MLVDDFELNCLSIPYSEFGLPISRRQEGEIGPWHVDFRQNLPTMCMVRLFWTSESQVLQMQGFEMVLWPQGRGPWDGDFSGSAEVLRRKCGVYEAILSLLFRTHERFY
jgi:hypothetical protein